MDIMNFSEDTRVVDAAKSLASLVRLHGGNSMQGGKPILFDMTYYMELVAGLSQSVAGEDVLVRFANGESLTEEEKVRLHKAVRASTDPTRIASQQAFIEGLSDAFTLDEVCEIASCYLVELGYTDDFKGLGEAWVFMVAAMPAEEQCHILSL